VTGSYEHGNEPSGSITSSFSRRTLLHGVSTRCWCSAIKF